MRHFLLLFLSIGFFISCDDETSKRRANELPFNQEELIQNWTQSYIKPAYDAYTSSTIKLKEADKNFATTTNLENFLALRSAYEEAYLIWQDVAFLDLGPAEANDLLAYTNYFPTNTEKINDAIASNEFDLERLSNKNAQGFPAIDYLLFGKESTDLDFIAYYKNSPNAKAYLSALIDKLHQLADEVNSKWKGSYATTFQENINNTASGSTQVLLNAYIKYFEQQLRKEKIGDPIGKFASKRPQNVEAYYSQSFSKSLLRRGTTSMFMFFNGNSYLDQNEGYGLTNALQEANAPSVANNIVLQFDAILKSIELLDDNFAQMIEDDVKIKLLFNTYDKLQENVFYMKTDMIKAIQVSINYQDNDGD